MSVVVRRRSADGRGRGAAGTGLRGRHGGRLKRAAVERSRLEGAVRGAVTLGQRGGGGLKDSGGALTDGNYPSTSSLTFPKTLKCSFDPSSLAAESALPRSDSYLCTAVSVLAAARQILHQNGGKDANHAVELALPEPVVLVGLSAQDADDGAFGE